MDENVAAVVGGLFTLITTGVAAWKWWVARKDRKSQEALDMRVPTVIAGVKKIYHEINSLKSKVDAVQVIVLRAENGGKIAQLGHDLHSSVVYEAFDEVSASVADTWKGERLDPFYLELLHNVLRSEEGMVLLRREDIPEQHKLRDIYESNGVGHAKVCNILAKNGEFYYMSVTFPAGKVPSASTRKAVRETAARLRRLISADLEAHNLA